MSINAKTRVDHGEGDDPAPSHELRASQELSGLARLICDGIELAEGLAKSAVEAARSVGQHLVLAKQKVAHGEWDAWVRENTPLSPRTAQAYKRLADQMEKLSPAEAQRVADLPLREAMKAIASTAEGGSPVCDIEVLDDVVDEPNGLDVRDVETLRKASALLETFAAHLDAGTQVGAPALRKLASSLNRSLKVVREHQTALERRQGGCEE